MTNIISKIFEKKLKARNENHIKEELTPYQCGGAPERSVADHLYTLRAIINEYRISKRNLYFGDLEKCFDKLCIKDSILEWAKTTCQVMKRVLYIRK